MHHHHHCRCRRRCHQNQSNHDFYHRDDYHYNQYAHTQCYYHRHHRKDQIIINIINIIIISSMIIVIIPAAASHHHCHDHHRHHLYRRHHQLDYRHKIYVDIMPWYKYINYVERGPYRCDNFLLYPVDLIAPADFDGTRSRLEMRWYVCEGHDSYNICFNDYTSHNDYHIHGAINDCTVRKNHIHSPRMPSPPLYLFPFFPCLFLHLCLSFSLSLSASVSFLLSLTLFVIGDT